MLCLFTACLLFLSPLAQAGPPAPAAQQIADIHNAASSGDAGKVSALLKRTPALIESRDAMGMTPLLVAARDGQPAVVTLLLARGASLHATTTTGSYDALALAAKNGQKEIVTLLLDKGADATRPNSDGDTPVALAQNEGHADVVALFKARGYAVNPAPAAGAALNWATVEEPVATLDSSWIYPSLTTSPDSRRIACGAHLDNKFWVVVDGADANQAIMTSDGKLDYTNKASLTWLGTVSGENVKHYDGISKGSPLFSPDSRQVAYIAWEGDKHLVVVDGKEGTPYDNVRDLIYSPDSKRMAYVATAGLKNFAVVDGKEETSYDSIANLAFSPDGKRVAYLAMRNHKAFAVIDGKEETPYENAQHLIFSPDSLHVAYAAESDHKQLVVLDGKEGNAYDKIGSLFLLFSPDSKHLTYSAKAGETWIAILDGKEEKSYEAAGGILFSPDSKRMAYPAKVNASWFYVVDGKAEKSHADVGHFLFSPDSTRTAYVTHTGDKWSVVVDGKESKPYDGVGTPVFSPDSKRVAYSAKTGDKTFVVVDGKEGKPYDMIRYDTLLFSPDSKLLAYMAVDRRGAFLLGLNNNNKGRDYFSSVKLPAHFPGNTGALNYVPDAARKNFVVINGQEQTAYDYLIASKGGNIVFDSPTRLHYLAGNGRKAFLVEETLQPH